MERMMSSMLSGLDLSAIHAQGPVIRTPMATIVAGYDEASRVLRDPERFSSEFGQFAMGQRPLGRTMLSSDPPDHTRLRGVVSKAFTPRSVALLEPRVYQIAAELLSAAGEEFDVIDALAYPLPVIVIAELLGVPAEDRALFKKWSDDLVNMSDGFEPGRQQKAVEDLRDYFVDVIERRRSEPGDDLVTRLVQANEDGVVSMEELVSQCVLLLVAGNETTTHLIGNAVNVIARHPAERARIEADPSLVANAVEEVLRFDGVVPATARRAGKGAELGGESVAEGTAVVVLVSAANRDPARFADPDVFDVSRHNAAQNLGFGAGIHFCLGAPLARLETRVAIETLMSRHPAWKLAAPEAPVEYTMPLRGPKHLRLCAC